MKASRTIAMVMSVAAALALVPGVVRACSCSGQVFSMLWPEMDAEDVPLNARIWVADAFNSDPIAHIPRLRPVGVESSVGFSTSTIDTTAGLIEVVTPDQPLAPNTTYELIECYTTICDKVLARFTTGASTDDEAPPLPSEVDRDGGGEPGRGNSCGTTRWASVAVAAEGLLVMEIDGGSLDPDALEGTTSIATFDRTVLVGTGGCHTGWPTDKRAAPVRYGVFDVAGNFSGWTEPDTLALGGCNCRSDTPTTPTLLALGVFALAPRRRRRRHRS